MRPGRPDPRRLRPAAAAALPLWVVALALAGCAAWPPVAVPSRSPTPSSAPAVPAYTAATTQAQLAGRYPFIRIAEARLPPTVRALPAQTYALRDGRALLLDLYLPAAPADPTGPRAAIVLVHGGGWRTGVRENLAPLAIGLAQRGYAAATVSYRLSPEARYPAAVHDVKAALRWLRARAADHGIDPARIAVGGASAGGQIASLVGVTNGQPRFEGPPDAAATPGVSSAAQAIVNIDGLSDFTSEAARAHEDDPRKNPSAAGAWFGGRYAEQTARWHEASPISHAGPATPPMLFVVSAQPRFSLGQAEMAARLAAWGVPTQRVQLPDTPHAFWLFEPWLAPTVAAVADFLDRQLPARR